MAFVVTPSGASAISFADTPDMGSDGKYWLSKAVIARRVHQTEKHPVPGQPGQPVKRHGFRFRDFKSIEVVYVKSSANACIAAYDADDDAMAGKACSLSVFGLTVPACEVEEFEIVKGPKKTGSGGMYRLHCVLSFQQLRTA